MTNELNNIPEFQTAARHIARNAQQKIKNKTGMQVMLMLCPETEQMSSPKHMLQVIALSLGMDADCFMLKSRRRDIVELRFIASLFLRRNFPRITLYQISALFGGQDHSSVLSGINRAHCLIQTRDSRFMEKYNLVLKSVTQWLRKEESGYASANSA